MNTTTKVDAQLLSAMAQEIEHTPAPLIPLTLTAPLPIPVQRFCGEIDKNFASTAEKLDFTAELLEEAAKELRSRASDLRDASPDVRAQVERWISFERESDARYKFFATLFDK